MATEKSEAEILHEVKLALNARPDLRIFRNNTGKLQDKTGRWVEFGLCRGSPDLVGWRTITVTPEMIGSRIAVFLGVETKAAKGRQSKEQKAFQALSERFGAEYYLLEGSETVSSILATCYK